MKKIFIWLAVISAVITVKVVLSTPKQDDMNYRKFMLQDRTVTGKPGVLLVILGQPRHYDFEFFDRYMTQIFKAAFPAALKPIILADKGTVLMDPDNLEASEEFAPKRLIDCYGNEKNGEGEPYVDLGYEWVPPRQEDSPGHFLWKEHTEGHIDIVEKVSIKICASYYGRMPNKEIPYMRQHEAIFKDLNEMMAREFPGVPIRWCMSMYPETIERAVDELVHEKVDTIVAIDFFHVYSALEEFNSLFEEIRDAVADRARVVFAPFPSAYASYRRAYVEMAKDEILHLPREEKKLIILTRHGFPEIPGDPYPELARVFYKNSLKEINAALEGTNTLVIMADTDFAGDDLDPDHKRLATYEALEMALEDAYDHVIFILLDFFTENTDTIFAHPAESLEPLHFQYEGMVPYPDFDKPFRLELQHGNTRVVSAGCPVGDRYRPHISRGFFDALATVLRGEEWPELVLKEEEKKEGMF